MASPEPLTIKLPPFNGDITLGLSAASETAIPENRYLVVSNDPNSVMPAYTNAQKQSNAMRTAIYAVEHFGKDMDAKMHSHLACAAYGAVAYGYIYLIKRKKKVNLERGSSFKMSNVDLVNTKGNRNAEIAAWITHENLTKVMTMLLGCKLNWWQTNHHTGQGKTAPYIQKTFTAIFGEEPTNEHINLFHTASHWIGTHRALNDLKIFLEYREESNWKFTDKPNVYFNEDMAIRTNGPPAGIAPHSLVHQTFRKFGTQPIWYILSDNQADGIFYSVRLMSEFEEETKELVDQHENNREDSPCYMLKTDRRVFYHMGARFLTESQREIPNQSASIGLIGSFLHKIQPRSTLTKSPIIQSKYQSHESYDDQFDKSCQQAAMNISVTDNALKKILGVSATPELCSKKMIVNMVRMATGKDVGAAYDEAAQAAKESRKKVE